MKVRSITCYYNKQRIELGYNENWPSAKLYYYQYK